MSQGSHKKVAVVTGASSGIGRGIAVRLALDGFAVALVGRSQARLQETAEQLGDRSHWILPCDITDLSALDELCQSLTKIFQQGYILNVVVNNAGIYSGAPAEKSSPADFRKQWETNFLAPVMLSQKLLKFLRDAGGGSIINISSTLGLHPMANTSAYSAAKAALQAFSKAFAAEVAIDNIRVNCVCPGLVNTPIHGLDKLTESQREQKISAMHQMQPLKRMGEPEDIAGLVSYLAAAQWMTGANLEIDGGISL